MHSGPSFTPVATVPLLKRWSLGSQTRVKCIFAVWTITDWFDEETSREIGMPRWSLIGSSQSRDESLFENASTELADAAMSFGEEDGSVSDSMRSEVPKGLYDKSDISRSLSASLVKDTVLF